MSTNIAILDGHLTKDPEVRATPNGTPVAQLRIAVQRPRREGEDQGADYFNVTAFATQAENCGRYLTKGQRVLVEGRMRHQEWTTDDGGRRQAVDIVARNVQFLSSKPDNDASAVNDQTPAVEAAA
jgi:single-strand DNA-binding protein